MGEIIMSVNHRICERSNMVQAILDGRKTQTRRVVKPHPIQDGVWKKLEGKKPFKVDGKLCSIFRSNSDAIMKKVLSDLPCSYGKIGDKLWIGETFAVHKPGSLIKHSLPLFEYTHYSAYSDDKIRNGYELVYRATQNIDSDFPIHWRSPVTMPKWAARIWLEITNIRIERVQDINEEDASDEGATPRTPCHWAGERADYRAGFKNLWDSINAKHGYKWNNNPWVWVIEFKRISVKEGIK